MALPQRCWPTDAECDSTYLPQINNFVYNGQMKYSEFRKWLVRQGAVFKSTKGSHFRVYLNGRQSIFPDHGAKEIGQGLVQKIKKDLGLK